MVDGEIYPTDLETVIKSGEVLVLFVFITGYNAQVGIMIATISLFWSPTKRFDTIAYTKPLINDVCPLI